MRTATDQLKADAAWTQPAPGEVLVHLTGFAPGCEDLDLRDGRRWKHWPATDARRVMGRLLRRLGKSPDQVSVRTAVLGKAVEVEVAIDTREGAQPAAFIADGLDLAAARLALEQLRAEGFRAPTAPDFDW